MLFTPVNKKTGIRLRLDIEQSEHPTRRGLGYFGTVTDRRTGTTYRIYGKACNQPHCQCDAWAVEVPPRKGES